MKRVTALAASLLAVPALAQPASVAAPAGPLQGNVEGRLRVFRGIPYAQPPVGPLRWKPPVDLPAWTAPRKATAFGPACIQPRSRGPSIYANPPARMSEDCLLLNIWTPAAARGAPVMVWIHGGALTSGYSHEPMYDGARWAARGIVVVSINYRLGALGYLAHPALSAESPRKVSGNYGLLDQIAALRWVRRNIAAFGGDPANVTIAGESAGALSVLFLMTAPPARGLFAKAIAQSGYMISLPELREAKHGGPAAEAAGAKLMTTLQARDLAALRALPAKTLTERAAAAGYAPWGTIDGVVLPRQLVDSFDRGEQVAVPVLAGFNSGEIRSLRMLLPPTPADAAAYERTIRARYGDLADRFLRLYPASNVGESMLATTRDALYGWTSARVAASQTARGQRAYLYGFDHGYPAADEAGLHAFHAAEIPYAFGTVRDTPPYWPKIPDALAERRLSDAMIGYWTSFARTGVPVARDAPAWPAFGEAGHAMVFARAPVSAAGPYRAMFTLHEAAACRRRAAGDQGWTWNTGVISPVLAKAAGCP